MTDYMAPVDSYLYMLEEGGLGEKLQKLDRSSEMEMDDFAMLFKEAGKFCEEVVAPTNWEGDQIGAKLENGVVRLPPSFMGAYSAYREAGWTGLSFSPDHGGQGLPWTVAAVMMEMLQSANMSWALNPLLTVGAAAAIDHHGSEQQKQRYLEPLVTGQWSGTMNLTEPQAGSDLSKIRTKAVKAHEDEQGKHYRISGQKIYITYGDHEAYENIIHLVLARIEGAPEGSAGISLFIVPKYLVNEDGSLGARNDLKPLSLESKLGIHGSPTCVMAYGENEGALGTLVGEENQGLALMFTMMNMARLFVGIQGLSIAERAYQQAREFAQTRRQGRHGDDKDATIIHHGDVRRMLMSMQTSIYAMRALLMDVMLAFDTSMLAEDAEWRAFAERRVDLMVPVVKSWFTDNGVWIASEGVQIHGGAGFVEETGAAQHYRDARILPIYEGTNGIQAMDLIGRKLIRDQGKAAREYIEEGHSLINRLNREQDDALSVIRKFLAGAIDSLENVVDHVLEQAEHKTPDHQERIAMMASDVNYLFGIVAGGISLTHLLLNLSEHETKDQAQFNKQKQITRYYAESTLSQAPAIEQRIYHAPNALVPFSLDDF